MKKVLLTLSIMTAVAVGTQGAFAWSWGCNTCQKADNSGCPVKVKKECNKPCEKKKPCGCEEKNPCETTKPCEECAQKAEETCGDCWEKKKEEFYCRLGLSDCQKEEARKICDKYKCETDAIKDKMKNDKDCLCDAINASCLDKAAVREGERNIRQDRRDMKKHLKTIDKEFKQILECDQKANYRKLKREMNYRLKKGIKYCCKICK